MLTAISCPRRWSTRGGAQSTNLHELAALYPAGVAAFFHEWLKFTGSTTPVVVSHTPRLLLIARDMHRDRRSDAVPG
jgi:hypothetical protein